MYKPFGDRVIAKINKHYILDDKKKNVISDDGQPIYEPEQLGTVVSSNVEGIKKGMKIIPIIRGGVPIREQETKAYTVVILDKEDIYAVEV